MYTLLAGRVSRGVVHVSAVWFPRRCLAVGKLKLVDDGVGLFICRGLCIGNVNSDLSQISHRIIKGLSVRKVMIIETTSLKLNSNDIFTASPHHFYKKCMKTKKEKLYFDTWA